MANWCTNYVSFYGKTDELQKELEGLITKQQLPGSGGEGLLPGGYSGTGYMFDMELEVVVEHEIVTLKYNTKWDIDLDLLVFVGNKYNLEFKGAFMEEQELVDTCGFMVGVKDTSGKIKGVMKTLAESGINFDLAYTDDDRPDGSECCYSEIIDEASDALARLVFNSLREISKLNKSIIDADTTV